MRSTPRSSLAVFLLAVACAGSTEPYPGEVLGSATNRTPSGLTHHLAVVRSTNLREATLNSVLSNQGSAPVRVIARICTFIPDDIAADPGITPQWALVDCIRMVDTLDLAPGASSEVLTLGLALAPGVRTGVTLQMPD
ncbi:MAG TPA: hypothetical protein VGD77_05655 [Gemmatimonadaceae bacterium]